MSFQLDNLFRKKRFDDTTLYKSDLSRVLGLLDVTILGISNTLSNSVYILIGDVIVNFAGPATVISLLIAAICTILAGLCYAEIGSIVPRSGTAYIYIFVTMGEFLGFILGWDLIIEYLIGLSAAGTSLSVYIDGITGNAMSNYLRYYMPINVSFMAKYPDFLAFGFIIVVTLMMVIGVKESSFLNMIFTFVNLFVNILILVVGCTQLHLSNWEVKPQPNLNWIGPSGNNETCASTDKCGSGGFFPFGITGALRGTTICFYAFSGFDALSATGEECINPKRNIPLGIIWTLVVTTFLYITSSLVLSLMQPYYMVNPNVGFNQAFNFYGMYWMNYLVYIGAIASLSTNLYASMFPMPRIIYSIASDGLIFQSLAYISHRFKTPLPAAFVSGIFAAVFSLLLNLNQLMDLVSLSTLVAYSVVAISVLILRYRPIDEEDINDELNNSNKNFLESSIDFFRIGSNRCLYDDILKPSNLCTYVSSRLVNYLFVLNALSITCLCLLLRFTDLTQPFILILFTFIFIIFFILAILIYMQPQNGRTDTFKIPLFPFVPILSVFINVYLLMLIPKATWIQFLVCFIIGILIYVSYGYRNSTEHPKIKREMSKRSLELNAINKLSESPQVVATSNSQINSLKPEFNVNNATDGSDYSLSKKESSLPNGDNINQINNASEIYKID